jgi:plasmid replication initiation protein
MIKTKGHKAIVRQSNDFIEIPMRMTNKGQLFFKWTVSKISPEDTDFQPYRLKVAEFMRLNGIKNGSEYNNIKELSIELLQTTIKIPTEKGEIQANLLASAEYFDNEGEVEVQFAPKMKPFLLQLKEKFTDSPFGYYVDMRSQYTPKLFDLLNRYKNFPIPVKHRYFTIEDFRYKLAIDNSEYPLYGDLKRRVITPAVNEINKYTNLLVEFKETKQGKKVVGIDFEFTVKTETIEIHRNFDDDYIQLKIEEVKEKSNDIIVLNIKILKKILELKGKEKLQYYIDNIDRLDYNKAERPTGFFIDAVLNEYKLSTKVHQKTIQSQRTNFDQREYSDEYFDNFFNNTKSE